MPHLFLPDLRLHYQDEGPRDGPALVLLHCLGLDETIWDDLVPLLPKGLRLIRSDMRGHGGSDVPPPPYAMGALIRDVERLLDHLGLREVVVLGLSIGGLVAQGLAVKRLDLVRGLILSNTAHRLGAPSLWEGRIAAVEQGGLAAIAEATMERWFSRPFRAEMRHKPWQDRLLAGSVEGWLGAAQAIAHTDFHDTTSGLRLPTMVIAASEDGSTPPDLVRDLADLIPGSRFHLLRRAGHLPFVEQPAGYAALIDAFLTDIGHI
jgi:3-oxoadipate enol-lactonase